jgi:predicted SAM-dependent methyltransferase
MTKIQRLKADIKSHTPTNLWALLHYMRHFFGNTLRKKAGHCVVFLFNPILSRLVLLNLKISRKKQIAEYFAKSKIRKLQLGAGSNGLNGWLNSEAFVPSSFTHSLKVAREYIFLDVCQPFPFEDNSVEYIFHEHVIEHINYHQGQSMLQECFRILKPGGWMRIATPNLQVLVGLYGRQSSVDDKLYLSEYVRFNSGVWSSDLSHVSNNQAVFVLNHALRAWGHQFIYDYQTLSDAVGSAGFINISREEPQKSCDSHLANLEYRKDLVGIYDALVVEAQKPSLLRDVCNNAIVNDNL